MVINNLSLLLLTVTSPANVLMLLYCSHDVFKNHEIHCKQDQTIHVLKYTPGTFLQTGYRHARIDTFYAETSSVSCCVALYILKIHSDHVVINSCSVWLFIILVNNHKDHKLCCVCGYHSW